MESDKPALITEIYLGLLLGDLQIRRVIGRMPPLTPSKPGSDPTELWNCSADCIQPVLQSPQLRSRSGSRLLLYPGNPCQASLDLVRFVRSPPCGSMENRNTGTDLPPSRASVHVPRFSQSRISAIVALG